MVPVSAEDANREVGDPLMRSTSEMKHDQASGIAYGVIQL